MQGKTPSIDVRPQKAEHLLALFGFKLRQNTTQFCVPLVFRGAIITKGDNMKENPGRFENSPKFVQNIVFTVILVALFLLVCKIFTPFFSVLLWSVILFVVLNPLHKKLSKNIKDDTFKGKTQKSILAFLFAVGTALVILVPIIFVASQFLKQVMDLIRILRDQFVTSDAFLNEILSNLTSFINDITSGQVDISPDDLRRRLLTTLNGSLNQLLSFSKDIILNIGSFIVTLLFMVFCLFFFYMDGKFLSNLFLNLIPIRQEYIVTLVAKFKDVTKNLFLGYIIVALVQAILAYVVFVIFRVHGALVFSCIVFICVFIPMIGGSIVWLPLGIARILGGDLVGGIVFIIVSAICISLFDNILRPFFLQNRIQLHPLIIFFSIIGGLSAFGFNGLVLGPMIVLLFLTVLDIFLTEHKIEHKKSKLPE
ncbi:MAG: AI-2E family transporter [Termitinemataceae bacterium]|nr:MAG: AI-2E family transporter [Termitinemataceae bacterium]